MRKVFPVLCVTLIGREDNRSALLTVGRKEAFTAPICETFGALCQIMSDFEGWIFLSRQYFFSRLSRHGLRDDNMATSKTYIQTLGKAFVNIRSIRLVHDFPWTWILGVVCNISEH